MSAKKFAVLTTGRQDWGLLRPLCKALNEDAELDLQLLAGGMALDKHFGDTRQQILDAGFSIAAELDWEVHKSTAAQQSSSALRRCAEALQELAPHALVLLGDRYETLAAGLAASLARVPIVHLHGGEETEGALDNSFRHALSKLSHLHFVAHQDYARRLVQMGEPEDSVHNVGALGIDNILAAPALERTELEQRLGCALPDPIGLVTVQPETLASDAGLTVVDAVIEAMHKQKLTWIITLPNADPGSEIIRRALQMFAKTNQNVHSFESLGSENYLALMRISALVLGNSSSGVIEAPSLRVPGINVGDRQKGRIRADSVIDVPAEIDTIVQAIRLAQTAAFRQKAKMQKLPFGEGAAAQRIVDVLRKWQPPQPPIKRFVDLETV